MLNQLIRGGLAEQYVKLCVINIKEDNELIIIQYLI